MRSDFFKTASSLLNEKFSTAKCAFIAGSVTRGEQTETSDIDIVVVYDVNDLPKARRSSLIYQDWPIELFIQNTNSLAYFKKQDIACGAPVLINMIAEGKIWPEENEYAQMLQNEARADLMKGPNKLSDDELKLSRYMVTDLLDDMESSKNTAELYGTLSALYQKLGNFYLRANGHWSGSGKSLTRAIRKAFPELNDAYESAFKAAFAGNTKPLSELSDRLLQPFGGRYWAGLTSFAPNEANLFSEQKTSD